MHVQRTHIPAVQVLTTDGTCTRGKGLASTFVCQRGRSYARHDDHAATDFSVEATPLWSLAGVIRQKVLCKDCTLLAFVPIENAAMLSEKVPFENRMDDLGKER